jgi:putative Holliday junction resolvase
MGLDVGERRIGVAIADELGLIASPLAIVERRASAIEEIRELARARGVDRIIVGLPTGLSGREGPQAAAVRTFAAELEAALGTDLSLDFWDERLTTTVAERALRERGGKRGKGKSRVDAIAAAVILQGYLDSRRARSMRGKAQNGCDAL